MLFRLCLVVDMACLSAVFRGSSVKFLEVCEKRAKESDENSCDRRVPVLSRPDSKSSLMPGDGELVQELEGRFWLPHR